MKATVLFLFGTAPLCYPPFRRLLTRGVLAPLRSLPSARLHGGVSRIAAQTLYSQAYYTNRAARKRKLQNIDKAIKTY